jgi:hypothetical protein
VPLLGLLALVCALLAPVLAGTPAEAATGRVRGTVSGEKGDGAPTVKVTWFTEDWTYLGARKARGGGYSLVLDPGTYHLQFTDLRPAYDVEKYYPADLTVTVTDAATTVKNVTMHQGAAIGGTVRAGGKVGAGARVVAANKEGNSFETTTNGQGQYALGGLPPSSYSVFTYDKRKAWVGKSRYLPRLESGVFKSANVSLTKRAGRFVVDLYAGDQPYPGIAFVTAVSRDNGQFWTEKASHGTVTFAGLYPGKYTLVIPGAGSYLGGTLKVKGKVRSGKTAFGSVRLTQRGASVSGTVVDANDPSFPLSGAQVLLLDGTGKTLGTVTSGADGSFVLGGQLTSRSDLRVVAGPRSDSPYLGAGTRYCKYGQADVPVAVTTGQVAQLGAVALPHLPDAQQDGAQCYTPAPRAWVPSP